MGRTVAGKSKSQHRSPQFEGELNEPIFAPFEMPERDADRKIGIGENFLYILKARHKKWAALMKHYNVDNFSGLAWALACDFVPGFHVLYDDPRARALNVSHFYYGHAYYGKGTKPKGSGKIPEWLNGIVLILIFRVLHQNFPNETEIELGERIVLFLKPELSGARHKSVRRKIGKTLRNRLAKARRTDAAGQ